MRASSIAIALGCALSLVAGCGNGRSSSAHRPGTEPLPSSEPTVSVPASSSQPMFAGPATGPPRRGAGGGPPTGITAEALARDERRRRELGIGPDSPESLEEQGRRIALQTMDEMRAAQEQLAREGRTSPEEDGPCGEAWDQRVARGGTRDSRSTVREQRAEFMRTCGALPEEQQRCLSITYLTAHAEECSRIQEDQGRRMARRAGVDVPR